MKKYVVEVNIEWPTGSDIEYEEIDAATWEALDQTQRDELCDDIASTLFFGRCNYGWVVDEEEVKGDGGH